MRAALPQLEAFLASDIGRLFERNLKENRVYRELPFTYKIDARRFRDDWTGPSEYAVMQGIVDCLIEDDGSYILLDYKSDRVFQTPEGSTAEDVLKDRYRTQLVLYQEALESILGIKIDRRVIYAFELNATIET